MSIAPFLKQIELLGGLPLRVTRAGKQPYPILPSLVAERALPFAFQRQLLSTGGRNGLGLPVSPLRPGGVGSGSQSPPVLLLSISPATPDDWAGPKETPPIPPMPLFPAVSSPNNPELIQDQKHESAEPSKTLQLGPCYLDGEVEAQRILLSPDMQASHTCYTGLQSSLPARESSACGDLPSFSQPLHLSGAPFPLCAQPCAGF